MALSIVTIPGDGATNTFVVAFALGFIDPADVTAWVTGEYDGLGAKVYRSITFLTNTLLQISGSPPANGVNVVFTRTVPNNALIVDYEDGDIMNEINLNQSQKQVIMLVQQVLDGRFSAFSQDVSAGGFRITNLGTPIAPTDAANKLYVDTILQSGIPGGAAYIAATLTELKALDTTVYTASILKQGGREGLFVWKAGNYSTQITTDVGEGLYVKADAVANTLGAWVRIGYTEINPLWFGVTQDGVASDVAFGRFIDAMVAFSLPGIIPTGTITLASKVTRNIGAAVFALYGVDKDASILKWTAADGGFNITTTNIPGTVQLARQLVVHSLALITTAAAGGTAFKHTVSPVAASSISILADFHDLTIQGYDTTADYWTNGIQQIDGWNSFFTNNQIKGLDDASSPFDMVSGIDLLRCNDCHITGNHIYHMTNGVWVHADIASYGDGHYITDNRIIGIDIGIKAGTTAANEFFGICNNHINAYVRGIELSNIVYTPVTGNTIFKTNLSTQTDWPGIIMVNGTQNTITGNTVMTPGAPAVVANFGFFVSGGWDNTICDNQFATFSGTSYGVYLTSSTIRNTVKGNHCGDGTINLMVVVQSAGATNYIGENYPNTGYTTFTSLDTTPTVGNAMNGVAVTANAGATSITTFDDGYEGQVLDIYIGDANTTFINGATLALLGAQNTLAPNGAVLRFRKKGTVWIEEARSYGVGNLIVGSYSRAPQSKLHSYDSVNALAIGVRIENDNGASPLAAIGFQVSSTAATESRSSKAGFSFERTGPNGTGKMHVHNRAVNDTADFTTTDRIGGWNEAGLFSKKFGTTVASAAAITPTGNLFHVSGTTTITSVSGTGISAGTEITIIFDGALTFTDGSNLKLAGNFVTTADDTITLMYDGTNWYEKCRAIN